MEAKMLYTRNGVIEMGSSLLLTHVLEMVLEMGSSLLLTHGS